VILSADEQRLYVSDSRAARIHEYDIHADGTLSGGKVFAEARAGVHFDNIRFDDEGRLWAAALADGIHCYDPDGTLIGRIRVPEPVANVTFGGPKGNRMFIAATTSLYSLVMSVTGAPRV
jgi:gluconolactonase